MTYCEDYPCCGHTDGLGCNWTYTPEAREFDLQHAMCDHEVGWCEAEGDETGCDGTFTEDDDGIMYCDWCCTPKDEHDD